MNVQGFSPEENAGVVTPSEDTMESATAGAIKVIMETGVSVFEDQVKALPTSVPETLMINGVEVNNKVLKKIVKDEVLKMTINGLGDKDGYDKAVAKLKELSKTRTGSKSWYTAVTKPVNKLKSDLLKQITETGDLCTEGETYLESIIQPIKNAVEIARQQAEEAKDLLAVTRAAEMVALGGVFDGQGTYNFPYDGALFINSDNLREYADEAYLLKKDEIQASFEIEQKRLQAIEDAKAQETTNLKSQVEDLNAERTEFRKEQLQMREFHGDGLGFYQKGEEVISDEQILYYDKDQWKELLNPTPKVETPAVEPEQMAGHVGYTVPVQSQGFSPAPPVYTAPSAPVMPPNIAGDFAGFAPAEFSNQQQTDVAEPEMIVGNDNVMTRSFVFSKAKPFIQFAVGDEYTMTIFPTEYDELINSQDELLMEGSVNEQLQFKLTQNAGA